jgi:glycosyltransferase involved in cell wall biosynthesis
VRIAQVSPLFESVPPKLYGGTERVVSYLTEELVAQGHDVTLFASADSVTSAKLIPGCDRALRLDPTCNDPIVHHVRQTEDVYRKAGDFDVIHFHTDYLHYPVSSRLGVARFTTLHGRLDLSELPPLYRAFPHEPVISISEHQRRPVPWLNWQRTVYHGLPEQLLRFEPSPGSYLAFLGRMSPEKGPDRAIELAMRVGLPLKMAAKIDRKDQEFYEAMIKPKLANNPLVEFVGEIGEADKERFLGDAAALLFPIDWPEPFGLVMIEAMACGTPVLAWRCGSVPEVIDDGVTGIIVDDLDAAEDAMPRLLALDRRRCRDTFEQRFCSLRMAHAYLEAYGQIRLATIEQEALAASY